MAGCSVSVSATDSHIRTGAPTSGLIIVALSSQLSACWLMVSWFTFPVDFISYLVKIVRTRYCTETWYSA